jgi:hypothetical protein
MSVVVSKATIVLPGSEIHPELRIGYSILDTRLEEMTKKFLENRLIG